MSRIAGKVWGQTEDMVAPPLTPPAETPGL
jgi:hypothetical protein